MSRKERRVKLLTKKVVCYVPQYSNSVDWPTVIEAHLCTLFGGCTSIKALGSYQCEDGSISIEPIKVMYSYTTTEGLKYGAPKVREFMMEMGRDTNKETVAMEINGKMEIWEVEHEKVEG